MKLKKLKIRNLGNIQEVSIEFDGRVTRLVGINGSGKTTIINAIWAAFRGIALRGTGYFMADRFRMIGAYGKSSDVNLTLIDEKRDVEVQIKRHITKAGNALSFSAPDNYPVNEEWLNGLLDVSMMSASSFSAMTGQQQAQALGIDTSEHDIEIAELKDGARIIRKQIGNFGELVPVEKVDPVLVSELFEERKEIEMFNAEQVAKAKAIDQANIRKAELINTKKRLMEEIESLQLQVTTNNGYISKLNENIDTMAQPEPTKSTDEIDTKFENAETTNARATRYDEYAKRKAHKESLELELNKNKAEQEKEIAKKTAYIAGHNFGIDDITIDESGALMCDNKPIKPPYFSTGELELIVARLAASVNPKLRVRFIDNAEALDEKNQEEIIEKLTGEGFQVVLAQVGNKRERKNTILLKDCKVMDPAVKEYEN